MYYRIQQTIGVINIGVAAVGLIPSVSGFPLDQRHDGLGVDRTIGDFLVIHLSIGCDPPI